MSACAGKYEKDKIEAFCKVTHISWIFLIVSLIVLPPKKYVLAEKSFSMTSIILSNHNSWGAALRGAPRCSLTQVPPLSEVILLSDY